MVDNAWRNYPESANFGTSGKAIIFYLCCAFFGAILLWAIFASAGAGVDPTPLVE